MAERIRAHGADVVADKIEYALNRWLYFLTPHEERAGHVLVEALRDIAQGNRIGRKNRGGTPS